MYYGCFAASYNDFGVATSQIKRVPLAGGSAIVLGYAPAYIGDQNDLVTDGSRLFWADSRGIRSIPIGGGAIQNLVLVHGTARLLIGLDANYLYYSIGRLIRRVPKAGGTAETVATAPNVVTALYVHAGSRTNIFWGEQGGAIRSLMGTHQNPISGVDVKAIGTDGTRLLWINCESPGYYYCSVNERMNSETTTVDGGAGARNLQWDATSMYWIGSGKIKRYVH